MAIADQEKFNNRDFEEGRIVQRPTTGGIKPVETSGNNKDGSSPSMFTTTAATNVKNVGDRNLPTTTPFTESRNFNNEDFEAPIDGGGRQVYQTYTETYNPTTGRNTGGTQSTSITNPAGVTGNIDTGPIGDSSDSALAASLQNKMNTGSLNQASTQTYTPISVSNNELVDSSGLQITGGIQARGPQKIEAAQATASQIEGSTQVESVTINSFDQAQSANVSVAQLAAAREAELAQTGQVSPTTAAQYQAALAQQTTATKVASGQVNKLVNAVEGQLSDGATVQAAIQELDQVDPRALVEAKTHDVPNSATVRGQMDNLLSSLDTGDIPTWAQPAVDQTEAMLASRGLSTSSVGKQALYNAIINSAMPMAQADAAARLSVFKMDITNEQQATLANSQFFQSLTSQNLSNQQQSAVANAATVAAMDMANADRQQQSQIENARNFLQMDLANLSNEQQANIMDSQHRQQSMLSNQAAENASRQFNAGSQQQTDQFNASLKTSIEQFNATQSNSMSQFNSAQVNQRNATQAQMEQQSNMQQATLDTQVSTAMAELNARGDLTQAQIDAEANKLTAQLDAQTKTQNVQLQQQMDLANMNATIETAKFNQQIKTQVEQFNAQTEFNRQQFNVQNATAIEQSNVQWRRQVNQANTAGQNAVNQANAMNAFNVSNQAMTFLWQEERDKAKWAFEASENEEERKTRMAIAALGNESMSDAQTASNITSLVSTAASIFDNWGKP